MRERLTSRNRDSGSPTGVFFGGYLTQNVKGKLHHLLGQRMTEVNFDAMTGSEELIAGYKVEEAVDQQSIDIIDKGIRHSDYPAGTAQDVTAERRATLVAHRDMLRNRILMERRYIETGR
jgi:hypothetical protein